MTTFDKVYAAVRLIPRGSVATYGQIAAAIGNKRLARVVGYALHVNPDPGVIPCHRVVKRDGEVSSAFAFGGANRQVELLKAEGVGFLDDSHADMKHCASAPCRSFWKSKKEAFHHSMERFFLLTETGTIGSAGTPQGRSSSP